MKFELYDDGEKILVCRENQYVNLSEEKPREEDIMGVLDETSKA